jgi:hypothetical protein
MKSLLGKLGMKSVLAVASVGALPTAAFAHDGDHLRFDVHLSTHGITVAPAPVFENREVRVWVEPVYRTVCDRVWVADQYEWRDIVHYENHWRRVYHERVLVQGGHYEDVQRQEVVMPGHWETRIERVRCG